MTTTLARTQHRPLFLTNAEVAAGAGIAQSKLALVPPLSTFAVLANAAGALTNDGSGVLSWAPASLPSPVPVTGGGTGTTTVFTPGSVVFAGASGVYSQDNATLFWDNTNKRLGIGTATPSVGLHFSGGTTRHVLIETGTPLNGYQLALQNSSLTVGDHQVILAFRADNGGTINNKWLLGNSVNDEFLLVGGNPSSTRLLLTTGGHLGIGVTSPTAALHLKAGTTSATTAPLKFTSGALLATAEAGAVEFLADAYYGTITTGAARKQFLLNEGTAFTVGSVPFATTGGRLTQDNAQLFWDDTSNRLGLGTTAPDRQLDVCAATSGGIGGVVQISNTAAAAVNNVAELSFRTSNAFGGTYTSARIDALDTGGSNHSTDLVFYLYLTSATPGGLERLRLASTGNVGIGVTNPTAVLHLKAGTAAAATAPLKVTAGTLTAALEAGAVEFVDDGTTGHLYITQNVAGVLTRVQIV